ncbi:histidine kinase (plasmid) [Legionella anisa]|nr:histidine kinase [Legionella anisa]
MILHIKNECLLFLSSQTVTAENLPLLIGEFLHTQPEHILLILAKNAQFNDAISSTLAHSKPYKSDVLMDRAISYLTDIFYKTIKVYYFQTKC